MASPGNIFFVIALFVFSAAAQASRPVTFDDLDGVGNAGYADFITSDISPDGRYLAISQGHVLQVMDAGTGRILHELGEGQLPRWSPHSDQLAFYSLRSGAMQLWIWNARNGRAWKLTDVDNGVDPDPTTRIAGYAIEAFDYAWSPDGTRLVFASRVGLPVPGWDPHAPLILDRSTPPGQTLSGVFSRPAGLTGGIAEAPDGKFYRYRAPVPGQVLRSRLFLVDIATRAVEMLDGQRGNAFNPQWSPDGRRLAFAVIDEGATDIFTASSSEIRVRDMATGTEVVVASGKEVHYRPRWSPDGKEIAYLKGDPDVDVGMVALDGTKRETYAFGKRVLKYAWERNGDSLLLSYADDNAARRLSKFRFGADALQPLAAGVDRNWSQADDHTLVWIEGARGPGVWILRPRTEAPVRLTSLGSTANQQADLRLGRLEAIRYRTAHGLELKGTLLYPPDYQEGKAYPLIVDGYPLVGGGYWMNPMYGNQAWAASGYMVFKPYARAPHAWSNCSGDPGFCALGRGPQGWDAMVDDVMSGVDELIRRGLVDPARMCAYGHSNGGGLVSYLITRTDRFRCAVVVAPVWPSWVGSPLLATQNWQLMADWAGVDPLSDPEAYMKLSAIFRAREVKTPLLLAAGDDDGAFMLGAIEMYNALRFAGADVTLLRYPDQGHLFKDDGLRDLWQREMVFFESNLGPK